MPLLSQVDGSCQSGQVYTSVKSKVRFFSQAPLENIEATSTKLRAALDIESGQLLFIIPINSFVFKKNLMRKHFNEQYLESDIYPEARFEGQFVKTPVKTGLVTDADFTGRLTVHGESRQITGKATLEQDGRDIIGKSTIRVRLADYNIKIPRMVIKNIAEVVEVNIEVHFSQKRNE
jgi:hypothetical protein